MLDDRIKALQCSELIGLDPYRYWQGAQRVDAGNIANDPEHMLKMRNQMYQHAVAIKKQRHESAIFAIERQPFFK